MATFNAQFITDAIPFNATMSVASVGIDAEWGDVIIIDRTSPEYEGSYDIIPRLEEQVLPTEKRQTMEDITVRAIPYAETTNVYGTTVVIAS